MQQDNHRDQRGRPFYNYNNNTWSAGSIQNKRSRDHGDGEDSSQDSTATSPWRAMKRLRVEEPNWGSSSHQHPSTLFPPPAAHTAPLRRTISNGNEQNPCDYSGTNHLLGSLHEERLRREKQRREQQQQPSTPSARGFSSYAGQYNAQPALAAGSPMKMSPIREQATPQSQQPRKVVHLQTNSKLR